MGRATKEKKVYQVEWEPKALKQLKKLKLGKDEKQKLYDTTKQTLSLDPYGFDSAGKREPLSHEWKGHWSYHYKTYRILYLIIENKILVEVVEVDHRKDVYKSH